MISSSKTKAVQSIGNSSDSDLNEGNGSSGSTEVTQENGCLSNSGFFDANLHFEGGTVQVRLLCGNARG